MQMDTEARDLMAKLAAALPSPTSLPLDQQREEDAKPDTAFPRGGGSVSLGTLRAATRLRAAAAAALSASDPSQELQA